MYKKISNIVEGKGISSNYKIGAQVDEITIEFAKEMLKVEEKPWCSPYWISKG